MKLIPSHRLPKRPGGKATAAFLIAMALGTTGTLASTESTASATTLFYTHHYPAGTVITFTIAGMNALALGEGLGGGLVAEVAKLLTIGAAEFAGAVIENDCLWIWVPKVSLEDLEDLEDFGVMQVGWYSCSQ
jgi:hypothetical protein